ncbi:RnaseH-domain-containing protein [Trametes coccinea BRFM310]|uniref:ribonuclease H n=1 Tax=Trametes coccinea (strain BRFM310) TaxID=1353009 RepID=A0A1Y2IBI3_TRAC3|nr:RnaseH-domain-containing protein [Trametes coccinea BRFM310]
MDRASTEEPETQKRVVVCGSGLVTPGMRTNESPHRLVPPFAPLHIVSDSKYVVEGLTKHAAKWEQKGWIEVANAGAFQDALALLRTRSAPTMLRWVKGHTGIEGNEGADELADRGASLDRQYLPTHKQPPREFLVQGALLKSATQRTLYRGIKAKQTDLDRKATTRNLQIAVEAMMAHSGRAPTTSKIWEALRRDPIPKKIRDFLWKAMHDAYRVGKYWENIPGYEDRARCAKCGSHESMMHILQDCGATETRLVWKIMRRTLGEAGIAIGEQPSFGLYLSAAAIEIRGSEGVLRQGATRLARILIPEAAYMVWRLRCRRVIEWSSHPEKTHSANAVTKEWLALLGKRLRGDQMAASAPYAKASKVSAHSASEMWCHLVDQATLRTNDWAGSPGVLVAPNNQRVHDQ